MHAIINPRIKSVSSNHKNRMLLAFFVLLLSPFLILTQFNCCADDELIFTNCPKTDTCAIGSTFEFNLLKLHSSLSTHALISGAVSNESFGNGTDEVYGLIMCFASTDVPTCIKCLKDATSNTTQPCFPRVTATVVYYPCMLSYSCKDFFSTADPYIPHCVNSGSNSLDQKTKESLMHVFANLSVMAPYAPEMFSYDVVNGTTVSALVQCTKDLSPQECGKCISDAKSYFSTGISKLGQ